MPDDPNTCETIENAASEHTDDTLGAAPRSSDEQQTAAHPGISPPPSEEPRLYPATIGPYRIIRQIGQGGMGVVYEAEQSHPQRRVALKVIRAGWATPELLRRFEQESHSLGRLHHPGIAQIYEAGSANTGFDIQPYFAMELIQGTPLVEYANEHLLDTRQRLQLMVRVCEAVQHAHQRGIIHRDLKPGNILVDDSGQPKILDFGLARATDSDAQATRQTDVGQLLGTLAYMSPEQVLADPLALDTRSDVYALGVILYQLLAGKMPYTLSTQLHEAVRTIQETEAAPLSVVNRLYRGDIETIVAKALEKDKSRRYGSAADLAADIGRHLGDQPITAQPASTAYQLRKFARRNRSLVAGVAAVFVVLVLGIVASSWEAVKARRAEKNARQESDIAAAVNGFLQDDVLAQASAFHQSTPDPDLKVRTALDRAAHNIQGKFGKQPAVEAAIRDTIGKTYYELGLYRDSRAQQEGAVAIERSIYGAESPITLETELNLAKSEEQQGKFAEADQLNLEILNTARRVVGPENRFTLAAMNQLTSVYDQEGKYPQGDVLGTQAVEISRRIFGPDSTKTLDSEFFLAIMLYEEGKYPEAESLGRHTVEARSRVLGPEHPDTLSSMNNLAIDLDSEGKVADGTALCSQVFEARRRVLGPEHPDTLDSMVNLADDLKEDHQYARATELDRQALEIQKRVLGPQHPLTLRSMDNLGTDDRLVDNFADAQGIDTSVLAIRRRVIGNDNPDTLWSESHLGDDFRGQRNFVRAEEFDRQAFEGRRRAFGKDNPLTLRSLNLLAVDLDAQKKSLEAEALYRKALQTNPDNPSLLNGLADLYVSSEDHTFRRPQEALDLSRRAVKAAPAKTVYLNTLGLAELRNGLWDDAIATLNKVSELHKGSDASDFFYLAMAYQGRHSSSDARLAFQRGVDAAKKQHTLDPDLRAVWVEAARSVGRPGPPPARPAPK